MSENNLYFQALIHQNKFLYNFFHYTHTQLEPYTCFSTFSPNDFYRNLATELGAQAHYRKPDNFRVIREELTRLSVEKRKTPVIIINEANYISSAILNDFKLLFNFEMDFRDRAVVLLSGLPSLNATLRLSVHEPFRQRIIMNYELPAFTKEEGRSYVLDKLQRAGATRAIFEDAALEAMQSTIAEQGQEIQKQNAHIARLAESDLVLVENEKLAEANRKLPAENEKAQNTFKEAKTKAEDAERILAEAKALNDTFDKRVRDKVSHVKRNMEADMTGRLQTAIQKQTVTLSTWTWAFCFICIIQTGYILYMNKDVTKTIPLWFVNCWENGCDIAEMNVWLYQWCYGCLTNYMHPYVVIGIMILASVGILIGEFFLFRNVFDHIGEKWHDRWQYYKVTGVKSLRKAVTVALCIVSITFAFIAGMCIPLDINVVNWWICFSVGLNLMYHSCCNNNCY